MFVKTVLFGYDLDNIMKVMDYVTTNYKGLSNLDNRREEEDDQYYMWFGMGDDVMNALDILSEDLNQDLDFWELVNKCKGIRIRKKRQM
jgi:hypothetical protein